ncbi:hypothetical protein E3J62_07650 [candidate division TA06 bacterium]|uniref:Uncharacterized protein n=1 Tax=candidate division TA06 bacterium TaxID=2250710 RepID=A0A523US89_UNCT6|nr:MAG: hypothetical protein E3J62_07650 [candidate division TA06 bacterium]
MSEDISNGLESFRSFRLNGKFPYFTEPIPTELLKGITPSKLLKAGFEEIDYRTGYTKTFSDVLDLSIDISGKTEKFYSWDLDIANFRRMLKELRVIESYLDIKVRKMSLDREKMDKILSSKMKRKQVDMKGWASRFQADAQEIMETVGKMKRDFSERYKDFLDIVQFAEMQKQIPRRQFFFFDFCKETQHLHMYFKFIKLFLNLFHRPLVKSKTYKRRLFPLLTKHGIIGYHLALATIKKIRTRHKQGASNRELRKEFPMVKPHDLGLITLEGEDKPWVRDASAIALESAAGQTLTTPGNFKQILNEEKEYAGKVRMAIRRMQNVEKALIGKVIVPIDPEWSLKAERFTRGDWMSLLRWYFLGFHDTLPKARPSEPPLRF